MDFSRQHQIFSIRRFVAVVFLDVTHMLSRRCDTLFGDINFIPYPHTGFGLQGAVEDSTSQRAGSDLFDTHINSPALHNDLRHLCHHRLGCQTRI